MLTAKTRLPIRQILLFGFLPSFLKVWIYRLRGYRIGSGVRIGAGSVVCGEDVEIGNHTEIGFLSFVRGRSIRLASHVNIGSMVCLDTPHLQIGEGTKINEQVFVGGLQFPDSRLVIGRNCQIMQMTFINPTRSITIGNDTGIGGDCLLFGHSSWLSKFEGYPVDFKPIEIGNSVSLAWRVFVLPGAKIGDGVVVGANSLVNHTIPPRCLAVGSPAKVVAGAPYFPRELNTEDKEGIFEEILNDLRLYLEGFNLKCRREGKLLTVVENRRRGWFATRQSWTLSAETQPISESELAGLPRPLHLLLSLRSLSTEARKKLEADQITWIDIENKERSDLGNDLTEEAAQFLKRYGVRLDRVR